MKKKQYFMYGVLVSYDTYLNTKTYQTVNELLHGNDDIQGIFTGHDGDFMIIGKVLETIEGDSTKPLIVPELEEVDIKHIENLVTNKYGFNGKFHYYFVKETR